MGHRGPIRFNARGELAGDILAAYWRTGFYVFEGLVDSAEIALLQAEMAELLDQAPIVNRQALHCSFPNTSPDMRVSLTFGFHRRSAVLGAQGALSQTANEVYDEQRIAERAAVIAVAIDARSQFYPAEPRYSYQPFADVVDGYRFSAATWNTVIKDYNLKDLSI